MESETESEAEPEAEATRKCREPLQHKAAVEGPHVVSRKRSPMEHSPLAPMKRSRPKQEGRESQPASVLRRTVFTPSPFNLNKIPRLPHDSNVDAVSLRDLIGDPLIRECWIFDFLFDVDWLM